MISGILIGFESDLDDTPVHSSYSNRNIALEVDIKFKAQVWQLDRYQSLSHSKRPDAM